MSCRAIQLPCQPCFIPCRARLFHYAMACRALSVSCWAILLYRTASNRAFF
ncbi:hypothetical protein RHMOL_Rhmol06G0133800 [Rhododendron molle]|uniref:Uncharacterized protein n=1 Tax=Rhododendron molle TaxID=49168 RepID=A0ACC0NC18_RHOML|nr:hypothetical protein RHMOL_Rhmol06G0133800 [Rhododendron molle]